MRRGKKSLIVVGLLACSALLAGFSLYFLQDAVWDGHFVLTLHIESDQPEVFDNLQAAVYWSDKEADFLIENKNNSATDFAPLTPLKRKSSGNFEVDVPCSGRSTAWGTERSYVQGKILLIEYDILRNGVAGREIARFDIPDMRKTTELKIALPAATRLGA